MARLLYEHKQLIRWVFLIFFGSYFIGVAALWGFLLMGGCGIVHMTPFSYVARFVASHPLSRMASVAWDLDMRDCAIGIKFNSVVLFEQRVYP